MAFVRPASELETPAPSVKGIAAQIAHSGEPVQRQTVSPDERLKVGHQCQHTSIECGD